MLYGVFSDVHSNLEALEAVLAALAEAKAAAYLCCGDLVGYGAEPDACLERVAALPKLTAVAGNHDLAAIGRMELGWFNEHARAAAVWTAKTLSAGSRRFLEGLSPRHDAKGFTLAHGSPRDPAEEYLLAPEQFAQNVPVVKAWPLFVGHSHLPLCFRSTRGEVDAFLLADRQSVPVGRGRAVALNPGSVGQPRDRDPRASCGLYDSVKRTFRLLRVPYDVASAQAKIRSAGLPGFLAERLAVGR